MLTIAISTFFALAFFGSVAVIAMMFLQYRDKIISVVQGELRRNESVVVLQTPAYRHRSVKAPQLMNQHRSPQPVPLRVAA